MYSILVVSINFIITVLFLAFTFASHVVYVMSPKMGHTVRSKARALLRTTSIDRISKNTLNNSLPAQ